MAVYVYRTDTAVRRNLDSDASDQKLRAVGGAPTRRRPLALFRRVENAEGSPPPLEERCGKRFAIFFQPTTVGASLLAKLFAWQIREQARSYKLAFANEKGPAAEAEGPFGFHGRLMPYSFHERSPCSSLIRVGKPIASSRVRNGSGDSSSTLTMRLASHSPRATSSAAATGGTPAV